MNLDAHRDDLDSDALVKLGLSLAESQVSMQHPRTLPCIPDPVTYVGLGWFDSLPRTCCITGLYFPLNKEKGISRPPSRRYRNLFRVCSSGFDHLLIIVLQSTACRVTPVDSLNSGFVMSKG